MDYLIKSLCETVFQKFSVRSYGLGICALSLPFVSGLSVQASTPAGQLIQNKALVQYTDKTGKDFSTQSNLAVITVRQVYEASLSRDNNKKSATGQNVYFSHTLTNRGNGRDSYVFQVTEGVRVGSLAGFDVQEVYYDANSNGRVDHGEQLLASSLSLKREALTLEAGEAASVLVMTKLPVAASGSVFNSILEVRAQDPTHGVVKDETPGGGADGQQATNHDRVTITNGPSLNVYKKVREGTKPGEFVYTVTLTNTGTDARHVTLFDGFSKGMNYVEGSFRANGIGASVDPADVTGDKIPLIEGALTGVPSADALDGDGKASETTEQDFNLDLDGDGLISPETVSGVFAYDNLLPANTTVSMVYTMSIDSKTPPDQTLLNTAYATASTDGDDKPDGPPVPSNTVRIIPGITYGLTAVEELPASPGVNDGHDDDGTLNKTVLVDGAPSGSQVRFLVNITNTGTASDIFELETGMGNFPKGTQFSFWNKDMTGELLNSNQRYLPDTGLLKPGETKQITVVATLPPGVSGDAGGSGYSSDLLVFSANDPKNTEAKKEGAKENITLKLLTISPSGVDLADTKGDKDSKSNKDVFKAGGESVRTVEVTPGEIAKLPLNIENDGTAPDTYRLSSGGSWKTGVLGPLPSGWVLQFRDSKGDIITQTPVINPGESFAYTAEIFIPESSDQALSDIAALIDDTNKIRKLDSNKDGDGDYALFFRVESQENSVSDILLEAIDIKKQNDITLTKNSTGQISPAGTIDYVHLVENKGNTEEKIAFDPIRNTQAGWTGQILVDTDGDGQDETPYESLKEGDSIYLITSEGKKLEVALDKEKRLSLKPGHQWLVSLRVQAPADAKEGDGNDSLITLSYEGGGLSNTDKTLVTTLSLTLIKTSAIDKDCDGVPETGFQSMGHISPPGACIVWQITGENKTGRALDFVEIRDAAPPFTFYQAKSLKFCKGKGACSFQTLSDAVGDDEGEVMLNREVKFVLKQGTRFPDGRLEPGGSVSVRFATQVE